MARKQSGKKTSRSSNKKKGNSIKKSSSKKTNTNIRNQVHDEIAAIIILVVGVFLGVAMHTSFAGAVGSIVSDFIKGMFGLGGFILSFFLILYSLAVFAKMNKPFSAKTLIWLSIIFIMLDLINAGRFLDNFSMESQAFIEVYHNGVILRNGGVVGMYLGKLIEAAIGPVGLYLLAVTLILIFVLLTFNVPISKVFTDTIDKKRKNAEKRKQKIEEKKADITGKYDEEEALIDFLNNDKDKNYKDKIEINRRKNKIMALMKNDDNFGIREEKDVANNENTDDKNFIVEEENKQVKINIPSFEDELMFKETKYEDKNDKELDKIKAETEEEIFKGFHKTTDCDYKKPPITLLNPPKRKTKSQKMMSELADSTKVLEETLKSFNVEAKVVNVTKGSSVTRYEIQPAIGVKVASIVRLADDIALNLRARSIRIEAPIPGKAAVGIEVENETREMVTIGEIISSSEFKNNNSKLAFAVGRDISGKPIVADLGKMPHMLIAGATGSGKSVCINTIIASILYNATPDEVKLVLIDPKMVELGNYNGIPNLLIPVVTDSTKAAAALNWAVAEMTDRYKKFAANGVREMKAYNKLMEKEGKQEEVLPQIVIIIDELADLMMVASSQVEEAICRLAQLARAAGMHLIVATQRPSVDVVTGLIKANIPSRIAFMVSSQIDSRTIIDMPGAEKLVGNGDMLYKPQDLDKPIRVQGPFISDDEVKKIINFVKEQGQEVKYNEEIISQVEKSEIKGSSNEEDELMKEAIEVVVNAGQASVSMLQRRFRIGYNRAARIIDDMELKGIIGPQDGSRPRAVLITKEDLENSTEEQ